jgi:phosphoadenosine phosphosulfate reductase
MQTVEWDEGNGLIKINPLINWSEQDAWDYVNQQSVPVNPLHKKGFPSIGCLPCTRAIEPSEDIRAGRWWWENPETKECGLHKKD